MYHTHIQWLYSVRFWSYFVLSKQKYYKIWRYYVFMMVVCDIFALIESSMKSGYKDNVLFISIFKKNLCIIIINKGKLSPFFDKKNTYLKSSQHYYQSWEKTIVIFWNLFKELLSILIINKGKLSPIFWQEKSVLLSLLRKNYRHVF